MILLTFPSPSTIIIVVGKMVTKRVHALFYGIWKYITLHGKRHSADVIMVKELKAGRLSWIISVGPIYNEYKQETLLSWRTEEMQQNAYSETVVAQEIFYGLQGAGGLCQRKWDLSPTEARNWIPPPNWINLEMEFPLELSDKNSTLMTLWFWSCETPGRETSQAHAGFWKNGEFALF